MTTWILAALCLALAVGSYRNWRANQRWADIYQRDTTALVVARDEALRSREYAQNRLQAAESETAQRVAAAKVDADAQRAIAEGLRELLDGKHLWQRSVTVGLDELTRTSGDPDDVRRYALRRAVDDLTADIASRVTVERVPDPVLPGERYTARVWLKDLRPDLFVDLQRQADRG